MKDEAMPGTGGVRPSMLELMADHLRTSTEHLHAVQQVMEEVRQGCEESRDRSRETVHIIDRFFETAPETFLEEIRNRIREMVLDASRSQHRAEYERLIARTY